MTPEDGVDRTTGGGANASYIEMIVAAAIAYSEVLRDATGAYRRAASAAEARLEARMRDSTSMFDPALVTAYENYLEESRSAWRAYDAVRSAAAESFGGMLQQMRPVAEERGDKTHDVWQLSYISGEHESTT